MALHSRQVTVTTTPIELYAIDADGVELTISTKDNVYIGDADVSTSTGFLLIKAETISLSLGPGEHVFGVSAGLTTVYVLATKNG